ncbi:bifunctional diguanylate cyclase/phosphodiesterase [Sinobaca sp. H24]|uniref:putative bifunctional diguanylate cyclase/phosphodiesterase n=1 Tax=Sinobaca sp. H24 TaxID=2923376 RepID=UPI00207AEA16|nr:EAL domain-containing protein [Sinobaca sp. H24]
MTMEWVYSTGTGMMQQVLTRPWLSLAVVLFLTALIITMTILLSREWFQERHKKWLVSFHDLYEQSLDWTSDAAAVLNRNGTIITWNRAAEALFGYSKEEALHQNAALIVPGNRRVISNALTAFKQETLLPLQARHKDGRLIDILISLQPREHFYTVILRQDHTASISTTVVQPEDKDALTGLPNRTALLTYLEKQTAAGFSFSVSYLSIDSFPRLTAALGQKPSETLLVDMMNRLLTVIPAGGFLARWNDCDFILVLPEQDTNLSSIWDQLRRKLQQPFSLQGLQLFAPLSIGVCFSPADGESTGTLLQHAYVAKRQAQRIKDTSVSYFDATMMSQIERLFKLEADLPLAMKKKELEIHYQPQINLTDRKIVSAEALLRWNHPTLGPVSPIEFIPIAEESEAIVPIGWWVIEEVLRQFNELKQAGTPLQLIAVNVSLVQLKHTDFPDHLKALLHQYQVDAGCLELELTESVMQESHRLAGVLKKLQKIGVTIALDDFGTGYSSLSRLYSLPLDRLKIDKSFIDDIAVSPSALNIVNTIIYLADQTGLEVLAEGVETLEQVHILKELNCTYYQGYYFSRPLPADALKDAVQHYQMPDEVPAVYR